VALALIPEAIAFAIIAGVDPQVGLYASFSIAIVTAFAGGRPGMISAATGSMALVFGSLVRAHGVQYLFAVTILTGLIQFLFGVLGVGRLMRFVPRTVMVGFINALAILIFKAQIEQLVGETWQVYALVVVAIALIWLVPRVTTAVPAPLVAVALVSVAVIVLHLDVTRVGDMGHLPDALPWVALPDVPFDLETLRILAPYAFTLSVVGLLESLLTAQLIDDITDTPSDKDRECRGQGVANVVTGFLGGMAGCAVVGQSMINMKSGGRTRLSTLAAGVFLLVLLLVFGRQVAAIPMAALLGVMIVVSALTFDWSSIRPSTLRRTPVSETAVMVVTVAIVVATHNLALGVIGGVLLAAVFFARRVARVAEVTSTLDAGTDTRTYVVTGELFFASTNELVHDFRYADPARHVVIDLTGAHVWDSSAVATLDAIVAKYSARGVDAHITGLNPHSEALHSRLSGQFTAP
jgi:SulP family sulfate permease